MRIKNTLFTFFGIVLLVVVSLSGCNRSSTDTPAPTARINATQSYETAVARVTEFYLETVQASGELEATEEPPVQLDTVEPTATELEPVGSATPVPPTARPTNTPEPCDRAAPGNPIDVTIPDDTELVTGQTFEKTWRLVNVGTCTWNSNYAVVWISGEQIGVDDIVFIPGSVAPGQTIDVTVPMTAPVDTGTYQSNWKLRNDSGVLFGIGDNADSVFWVRIEVVKPTATPTKTPSATNTPTSPVPTETPSATTALTSTVPTETTTPVPSVHNSDTVNPGSGVDQTYTVDAGSNHFLTPLGSALIGVYGSLVTPEFSACQSAGLESAVLAIEVNTSLCYKTDSGRYGRIKIASFNSSDGALSIEAVIWVSL